MKTIFAVLAVSTLTLSGAAFADGHRGNSANAQTMVDNIESFGGSTATRVSPKGDLTETFGVGRGDYGWGNAGSRLTSTLDDSDVGGQVSKSGKFRNK